MTTLRAAALSVALLASPLAAQQRTLDMGRFTVTQNGERLGTEDFSLRFVPMVGGPILRSLATLSYSSTRVVPILETDTTGTPMRYQLDLRDGTSERRMAWRFGRDRYTAHVQSSRGESTREDSLAAGAVVVDEEVYHQYFFIAHTGKDTVPVFIPRRNEQVLVVVSHVGTDTLSLGGQPSRAEHVIYRFGASDRRDVWLDVGGHVVKVVIPAKGIVAVRDDLSR